MTVFIVREKSLFRNMIRLPVRDKTDSIAALEVSPILIMLWIVKYQSALAFNGIIIGNVFLNL